MNDELRNDNVVIGLTGDVMIGRLVNECLREAPPEYIWGDVLPLLLKNDVNIINLEAALTTSVREVPKVFNFKSDPEHVESLKVARVDVANLANNHVLDYSEEGLLETLDTLDAAAILSAQQEAVQQQPDYQKDEGQPLTEHRGAARDHARSFP